MTHANEQFKFKYLSMLESITHSLFHSLRGRILLFTNAFRLRPFAWATCIISHVIAFARWLWARVLVVWIQTTDKTRKESLLRCAFLSYSSELAIFVARTFWPIAVERHTRWPIRHIWHRAHIRKIFRLTIIIFWLPTTTAIPAKTEWCT